MSIQQIPEPGQQMVLFRGDTVTFDLSLPAGSDGSAWLRTNIGHAAVTRREIIRHTEQDIPPLGQDWFDIPMRRIDERRFSLSLPLTEIGRFEAKGLFLPADAADPLWPEGPNTIIHVEPEDTCCANIIYNAFVRQFGPNKGHGASQDVPANWTDTLDREGYTVIPPSGTFRDLIQELDFIMAELGCRIIQLLPIHPTPTTFGRMGRYGSPYAALSFTTVDPALAEFDPKSTPLEQFIELVDAVHRRNGKVIIDIAVNHTGWGADLHESHPHWLARDGEGNIEVPGAWGVLWEDLTKLDYGHRDLWLFIADVFLTWCRRGVDGFRCDAAYMIPVPAWQYVIARVRDQFPETIFLLEGLGGEMSVTRDLLNTANFNWAYSELFQNYDRSQIEAYLRQALPISQSSGNLIHFAETHDNPRLAARSPRYARMRTALCALLSCRGGFGFANGVEWYATDKIVVHEAPGLNWGASDNQVAQIGRISRLLRSHPAFHHQTEIKQLQTGEGNCIALLRRHLPTGSQLLVLINLDDEHQTLCRWKPAPDFEALNLIDMLTGAGVMIQRADGDHSLLLEPGQALCLADDMDGFADAASNSEDLTALPLQVQQQRIRAKALDVMAFYRGVCDLGECDMDQAARDLAHSPVSFCRNQNRVSEEPRVITLKCPRDLEREVMVPPDHFLMVLADIPFSCELLDGDRVLRKEDSLQQQSGVCFALLTPLPPPSRPASHILKLKMYASDGCHHQDAALLYLPRPENAAVERGYLGTAIRQDSMVFLSTNGQGGMLRSHVSWGELHSRYDGLLAANLNPEFPEDRRIMFARCRMWLVYQGYSRAIDRECLDECYYDEDGVGYWQYSVPVGQGEYITLIVAAVMHPGENRASVTFSRLPGTDESDRLTDAQPVRLIVRPDVEDRSFHETTKAFTGPEERFPAAVMTHADGFTFSPATERVLDIRATQAAFVPEPEWTYMVYRRQDEERGMDPNSDLFSPGYFSISIKGGESSQLTASIHRKGDSMTRGEASKDGFSGPMLPDTNTPSGPGEAAEQSLNHFIVKGGDLTTVIAGYPWFLDWGRDALIVTRGLISAGRLDTAKAILKQFGRFESSGTLPNVIRGGSVDNRDTTDAPLWFCVACADLAHAMGGDGVLEESWEDRTIRQVLLSIGDHFCAGTPNGIRMDPESGLIYSPVHFTWMDTDHPAATPREGYPVEIQALWHAALCFLAQIDGRDGAAKWHGLADQVGRSILRHFYMPDAGYLSDCLRAGSRTPAAEATADDALRPNQLLAVTLKAIDDEAICRKILAACEELLVPGAIRSLADRPVVQPLEIRHGHHLLNDPHRPYQGRYIGDEDTQRKPAYHNGTAWTWLLPSYCEAWSATYGKSAKETALSLLCSSTRIISGGCVGHFPEILDGDYPHQQRGCDAQAWGASEWLRVWNALRE